MIDLTLFMSSFCFINVSRLVEKWQSVGKREEKTSQKGLQKKDIKKDEK